jgi:succinate dehydrogenase / fumarate reductase cytochrome b subunit
MRMTGFVVAAFLVYHLAHFTVGWVQHGSFKTNFEWVMQGEYHVLGIPVVAAHTPVHDVHMMVVLGFQNVLVSLFYVVAIGLLSMHLWHGFESAFQSLGLRSTTWGCALRFLTRAFVILYFLGNLAIPGAVLAGFIQPHAVVPAVASVTPHP